MSWWRFWDKGNPPTDSEPGRSPSRGASAGEQGSQSDPARERRIAELNRRRDAVMFDVEQGELASQQENPWQQRIELLSEAIATVEADRARLSEQPPEPSFPVSATPIADIQTTADEPADVRFSVGGEQFHFAEEIDWAERGTQVVRGAIRRQSGDIAALVPADIASDLSASLSRHLTDSLFVFATDMRDRTLAGKALPDSPTLADLAQPCSECGGWRDWRGRCPSCALRDAQRQSLDAEVERLEQERTKEAEERHRWTERLPIARRRLADIESDLASFEG